MTKTRTLTLKNLMQDFLRCMGDKEEQDKMWYFAMGLRSRGYITGKVWADFNDAIAKLYFKCYSAEDVRWEDGDGNVLYQYNLQTFLFDKVVR